MDPQENSRRCYQLFEFLLREYIIILIIIHIPSEIARNILPTMRKWNHNHIRKMQYFNRSDT